MEEGEMMWPESAGEIEDRVLQITAATESTWNNIGSMKEGEKLTYSKVVAPLVTIANYKTNPLVCEAKFLQHCSPNPAIREAAWRAGETFKKLRRKGRMREDVFRTVKRYAKQRTEQLDSMQLHFLESIMRDFTRSGLSMSPQDRNRLEHLRVEETKLCKRYNANVGEDTTVLKFKPHELEGLGKAYTVPRMDKNGDVCVGLKYPDVMPVMTRCSVSETRRQVAAARELNYGDNLEIMVKVVNIRQEIARLLGYPSYADYTCEKAMAGKASEVKKFLAEMKDKLTASGKAEYEELRKRKERHMKEANMPYDGTFNLWDVQYYSEMLTEERYGIDEATLTEHFPLEHVVTTTLKLYEGILGLRFVEREQGTFRSWHQSVRHIHAYDSSTEQRMGSFYLDLHPRQGKYVHAAIFFLRKRRGNKGPVSCMLASLPEGTAANPACIGHRQLRTFFHEIGHIMHGICAEGDGNMTRLAKCPRDFMEAPSQMLENWCWDKKIIKLMSKHVVTGEPLADELIDKLVKSRFANASITTLNNVFLSSVDLALHMAPPKSVREAQELVDTLRPETTMLPNPPNWNMLRNFCHVMEHYPAAYYSYLWSEVISADMFCTRFANDISNSSVGREYRKLVLAPGGVGSATDLVSSFLGRKPSQYHFLRQRGACDESEPRTS
eukprot:TRINITY_DN26278_c0_g1_i1.p1 TRINITY_DN26278_c0_g1~~TRINITY_DN26278_c0_g1_i1.p1  ORF type:complete len:677 (+),score=209.01 TRINITY_DN26278_c0_g1_i1:31-2031(+)